MTRDSFPKVLFVDDDPLVLSGLRRTLGTSYRLETAESGNAGLQVLGDSLPSDPFGVVVSDMRMPEMNGAEFLRRAGQLCPDAVLLILSGQADLASTVDAVNDAHLFRFLTKPCDTDDLRRALDDALRQYQLVMAERDLLERTVAGAVDMMVNVLAIANPEAFTRSDRVVSLVEGASRRLGMTLGWELRLAAMLSQIGCVSVPETILERIRFGAVLSAEEQEIFDSHPGVARSLIRRIPRLENVADWVGAQPTGSRTNAPAVPEQELLYAAMAFLEARSAGCSPQGAATQLAPSFRPETLQAVLAASGELEILRESREVTVSEIQIDMILEQDVLATSGMKLVGMGERVSETLLARLRNFARTVGVVEPIRVLTAPAATPGSLTSHAGR